MKTKTIVVYYLPLLILFSLVVIERHWAPMKHDSAKVCTQYANCSAVNVNVQNWLDFR